MTIPWLRLSTRVAHFLGVTLPEETDFHVGVEAWGRGDYERALREFLLLAEQGHALAPSLFRSAARTERQADLGRDGGFCRPRRRFLQGKCAVSLCGIA